MNYEQLDELLDKLASEIIDADWKATTKPATNNPVKPTTQRPIDVNVNKSSFKLPKGSGKVALGVGAVGAVGAGAHLYNKHRKNKQQQSKVAYYYEDYLLDKYASFNLRSIGRTLRKFKGNFKANQKNIKDIKSKSKGFSNQLNKIQSDRVQQAGANLSDLGTGLGVTAQNMNATNSLDNFSSSVNDVTNVANNLQKNNKFEKLKQFASDNKKPIIGAGVGLGVGTGIGVGIGKNKRKKEDDTMNNMRF